MKIALISDIHANLVALESVTEKIENESPDQVICLGDVASTGPQPRETIAKLHELNFPTVLGNADAYLLNPEPPKPTSSTRHNMEINQIFEINGWCAKMLSKADLDYLKTFKPTIEVPLGASGTLLCFHGSPRSNTEIIQSTTTEEELEKMLSGFKATVMAGGHTHTQMIRRFRETLLVNPGSVGLPAEWLSKERARNPAWAEYAMVHHENNGLGVELRRIPVDLSKVLEAARRSGMPHADLWMRDWK